ncbi:MAG: GTPase HflX [Candidatus Omnitrophota bacterium]
MYEVKESAKEKIILVTIISRKKGFNSWEPEDIAAEFNELANSTNILVVDEVLAKIDAPSPVSFIGKGKAEEIHQLIHAHNEEVDAVFFSESLSSTQQRNLEEILGVKTIDRTQLILDIFAHRAHSNEGKLQVELAQLEYLLPRLSGKGIILSRLGGGIGTRGPGEQKLEVDRRRIRKRIERVKKDLEKAKERRAHLRRNRQEHSVATVALVGYTNAGKSTLLNNLTGSEVTADNRLFCTLDPTSRGYVLSNNQKVLFVDTVGFIHNLPHNLVEAFKATLEEVQQADLLVHVLDVSSLLAKEQYDAVYEVLKELGCENKPVITALNKDDLVDDRYMINRFKNSITDSVVVSGLKRQGFALLDAALCEELNNLVEIVDIFIPYKEMGLVSELYKDGKVLEREDTPAGIRIKAQIPTSLKGMLVQFLENV